MNCTNFDSIKNIHNDPPILTAIEKLGVSNEKGFEDNNDHMTSIRSFLDYQTNGDIEKSDINDHKFIFVTEKVLKTNASWCFDIVTPAAKRSACFTSSYGKFVRGTGSVLYIGNDTCNNIVHVDDEKSTTSPMFQLISPEARDFDTNWNGMDLNSKLRYFTGTEMARLMGFPTTVSSSNDSEVGSSLFSFPSDCSEKQRWKLMGNSLNVKVAGKIAELALRVSFCVC